MARIMCFFVTILRMTNYIVQQEIHEMKERGGGGGGGSAEPPAYALASNTSEVE